ncbi:hypothetical protein RB195_008945 [Necator americanus]
MGGERAAKDELPWAALLVLLAEKRICGGTLISRRHIITAAHCFWKSGSPEDSCSVENMLPEGDIPTGALVRIGGTCLLPDKKHNCTEEDLGYLFGIKRASYRSFFEYRCSGTRDIAILELTADVPEHIHHICLPHMNKKIDISDSSLRMSSFGWGGDPIKNLSSVPFLQKVMIGVKMTEKECKSSFPEKLDDTFCTFERPDRNVCHGDSGGGITARIDGRTYLAGVVSFGSSCDDLQSGRAKPEAQVNTDVTKYAALIDSWLGTKKSK